MQNQIDLIDREISRLQTIINGLKDTEAWNLVLEDSKQQAAELDARWCWVKTSEEFQEMRVTKMAVQYILNLIETYETALENALRSKSEIVNVKDEIVKDVDNEI